MSTDARSAKRTIDHEEIRRWVEERGGVPASVEGTERSGEAAGLLRIDFGEKGEPPALHEVNWDEFFEKFEESALAFLYEDQSESYFCKFVRRNADEEAASAHA